jgi:hypothetical protein
MSPVRAAEPLNGGVGAPAAFEQVVIALRLIVGREARMVAASGAARVGEDQDLLGTAYEGVCLGQMLRGERFSIRWRPWASTTTRLRAP